jgi:iron(III) transport system substrate-binding protein
LTRLGEEEGWAFLKKLNANVNQYTKSGDAPVRALALGETSIAIAFLHGMTPKAVEGAPIQAILPCEGSGYEVIAMSMIAGGPNPNQARRFVDFALTEEAQAINAELGITAAPSLVGAATAAGTPSLAQIKLGEPGPHAYATAEARARVLRRFEAEIQ